MKSKEKDLLKNQKATALGQVLGEPPDNHYFYFYESERPKENLNDLIRLKVWGILRKSLDQSLPLRMKRGLLPTLQD